MWSMIEPNVLKHSNDYFSGEQYFYFSGLMYMEKDGVCLQVNKCQK